MKASASSARRPIAPSRNSWLPIDETADAVISRARSRADEVLAAARRHTDAQPDSLAGSPLARRIVRQERVLADDALRNERTSADKALRQERAEHVGLLAVERNETDKDLLSERERSDTALATRDEFLGIVGHDLRTMLNAVVGYAALIGKAVEGDVHAAEVLSYARRIDRSALRMNRLIGDLLDVASIEAGRLAVSLEMGDPAAVVAEARETFDAQASASGLSLETEIVSPAISISFDPARILQVLTNLLSNAIKFTPGPGAVRIRMERMDDDMVLQRERHRARDRGRQARSHIREVSPGHAQRSPRSRPRALHLEVHRRGARRPDLGGKQRRRREHVPVHAPDRARSLNCTLALCSVDAAKSMTQNAATQTESDAPQEGCWNSRMSNGLRAPR